MCCRIFELELCLSKDEERLLKVDEGQVVAEPAMSRSQEAYETALDSLRQESARSASLEVDLADTERSFAPPPSHT